jgi:hypothetical protein
MMVISVFLISIVIGSLLDVSLLSYHTVICVFTGWLITKWLYQHLAMFSVNRKNPERSKTR